MGIRRLVELDRGQQLQSALRRLLCATCGRPAHYLAQHESLCVPGTYPWIYGVLIRFDSHFLTCAIFGDVLRLVTDDLTLSLRIPIYHPQGTCACLFIRRSCPRPPPRWAWLVRRRSLLPISYDSIDSGPLIGYNDIVT